MIYHPSKVVKDYFKVIIKSNSNKIIEENVKKNSSKVKFEIHKLKKTNKNISTETSSNMQGRESSNKYSFMKQINVESDYNIINCVTSKTTK